MKGIKSSRLTEFIIKTGLIAAIATALLAPMTINANGHEAMPDVAEAVPDRPSWNALVLPPITHLETMPWLVRQHAPTKSFELDMLLGPAFEFVGPAVAGSPASSIESSRNR
jgi:hypothetical protein